MFWSKGFLLTFLSNETDSLVDQGRGEEHLLEGFEASDQKPRRGGDDLWGGTRENQKKGTVTWVWVKFNHRGTAGFGFCFLLPCFWALLLSRIVSVAAIKLKLACLIY